ncbi:MAG: tRNA 4-thiouridine(8) synthase ThiI [Treponema sp.]|jgi:thiamine biosynthesis protein ThiI|nr:tRNA 4-thiouridine(8) synthase ThiI [Treponema sp.]
MPDQREHAEQTYLLKLGELTLKGGNRREFERVLKHNLAARLRGTGARITSTNGRFYVRCGPEASSQLEAALSRLPGIAGWAKTRMGEKTPEAVLALCVETARDLYCRGVRTFKLEARRTDKGFPLDSYGIRCAGGGAVQKALPEMRVDVQHPQGLITVEIREKAYVYALEQKGLRGLPVGTAGRGMLLLSGGIDSPVAGYMMLCRGMALDGVYFHAYPYTASEAQAKALALAEILGRYALGMRLYTVNSAPIQLRIKEQAPPAWATILLRMAMMEGAEMLARRRGIKCLVTGESLSQVASQTIENIACTQSRTGLPVLRPLIGMDKEGIIRIAKSIGAYATSILPYQDCCILFSPPHPVLRGNPQEAGEYYERLALRDLLEEAIACRSMEKCGFPQEAGKPRSRGAGPASPGALPPQRPRRGAEAPPDRPITLP